MDLNCFYLLLAAHLLGDYYLQWDKMSDKKDQKWGYLLVHSAIYMVVCVIFGVITYSVQLFYTFLYLAMSHFAIDVLKKLIKSSLFPVEGNNQRKQNKILEPCKLVIQMNPQIADKYIYIFDQLLHLGFVFLLSCLFISWGGNISLSPKIHTAMYNLNLPSELTLRWIVILLLIGKPVNVAIKKIIVPFKPTSKTEDPASTTVTESAPDNKPTDQTTKKAIISDCELSREEKTDKILNAGAFIGFLERLIIVALLSIQQYASIGLVLTAKSIVRYNKISKDSAFADYYLLGTLMSILSAICFYLLILP